MRLAHKSAVVLVGAEHSKFFFAETDKSLDIRSAYPFMRRLFDPDFYFFADQGEYLRQRRILLPRFQADQLAGYLDTMHDEVDLLMKRMADQGELEVTQTFGPLVMRIGAQAFLGRDLGLRLGDGEFRLFRQFTAGMRAGLLPRWIPSMHRWRGDRASALLRTMIGDVLRDRRDRPADPPDFLQLLSEARYADGDLVPDRILISMVLFLLWAGHETTTGHLAWVLLEMLRHPEELALVRDERAEIRRSDDRLTLREIGLMNHLDGVVREVERLHPPAVLLLRTARRDLDYHGFTVPKGTLILASPHATHVDEQLFPDPHRFWPARFAEGAGSRVNLIGFGGGMHRCLGVHFAYLEIKAVVSALVHAYDFEFRGVAPRPVTGARTKWPASPCRLRYSRRALAHSGH